MGFQMADALIIGPAIMGFFGAIIVAIIKIVPRRVNRSTGGNIPIVLPTILPDDRPVTDKLCKERQGHIVLRLEKIDNNISRVFELIDNNKE